ncbi:exo-beta-N-acetylmuramidase NamZ domain-containing protein [Heyndrickxia coagulans]|uniref:exo-beta-N-acetylmuramidase NamZ domain-containing protein n=1 Tax=Heyndrickxia coagulans TaxID=1398 RepID=UPI001CE249E5|nr:exo-beta-N-acetylmuramidase NamZ domain-containing protein [Heyndrickxia coagulans]
MCDHRLLSVHFESQFYPGQFTFRAEDKNGISYFDQLIGNGWVRQDINRGASLKTIARKWQRDLGTWKKKREKYLMYKIE